MSDGSQGAGSPSAVIRGPVGYYVHHHGSGHLRRAEILVDATESDVTVFSSLERPAHWRGQWVQVELDAPAPTDFATAREHLHWTPLHDKGMRSRMASIAAWIDGHDPVLFICDVSVEVALLARLHGVPVVTVAQPGERTDAAHSLGYGISEAIVGFWPECIDPVRLASHSDAQRIQRLGALGRHGSAAVRDQSDPTTRAVFLSGTGGIDLTVRELDAITSSRSWWEWSVLGPLGQWTDDPASVIAESDVVVTHAGQNAIAEVAQAQKPALLVPQSRPFDEQFALCESLVRGGWPVLVAERGYPDWGYQLDRTLALDGSRWNGWTSDSAAHRFWHACDEVVQNTRHGP